MPILFCRVVSALRREIAVAVTGFALTCSLAPAGHAADDPVRVGELVVHTFTGAFEDVRERLVFAIEQQGLAVSAVAPVGEMLRRTQADVPGAAAVYREAIVVQFCSSVTAHAAARENPHLLALCPFSVAVYSLQSAPSQVHVSYRTPMMPGSSPEAAAVLARSDALLRRILEAVAE